MSGRDQYTDPGLVRESELVWNDADTLAAWTARLEVTPKPELSARHKLAVWVLLDVTALLVLLVVGRIVWQGISAVVGL